MIYKSFPAPFQCPSGTYIFIYNKSSVHLDFINISSANVSGNMADILKPSSGQQFSSPVTFKIELTPDSRITQIHINMQAENAQYVQFTTDNDKVPNVKVVSKLAIIFLISMHILHFPFLNEGRIIWYLIDYF